MPFDQSTRNRLARFVGDARAKLTEEFTRQLQQEYGLDPARGEVTDLARLSHLDDSRRATALLLRETLHYYLASQPKPDVKARREMLDRIVREQAFTILNRLCALRMAESRGLLIESVGLGYRSKGFQLYSRLAGTGLGETGDAYRWYLFSLFDEIAVDLPALFDRYAPEGRLFPREAALLEVLALINAPDIVPLWTEDETIGWIYQYFNSGEERRQMRAESQAPRNSRELAVRNQFFTPRYVVEFLTDNTLGRIWYEMTQGRTGLAESCRYLVRRPNEIFLAEGVSSQWPVVSGQWPVASGQADHRPLTTDHRLLTADDSQEELLRQPVYIPHRPLKDPRDIKMLDPACGSMHFGLYAFDLFERIYEEAWEMQGSGQWSVASDQSDHRLLTTDHRPLTTDHRLLTTDYSSKAAFLADVPRLIIEHNIHGIDIDPRAVQIAGLSLWLRAQRSWQAQGLRPPARPAIQRSHIVCAEPMPGDQALLDEFLAHLRADRLEGLIRRVLHVPATQQVRATERMAAALCDLVRVVWDEMKLAGEAGSLLKIEETLANAVRAAEREWSERMPLFRVVEFSLSGEAERVRYPRSLAGEDGADFWQQAEALVLAALQDYAEQAQNGVGYQRRLFAADAARGFAFVDMCRKHYDVVLMNPPFGEPSVRSKTHLQTAYPDAWKDLLSGLIERCVNLLEVRGGLGAITSRTCLFLSSFQEWRKNVIFDQVPPTILIDLGQGVLDSAMVETAAYCLFKQVSVPGVFIRLIREYDKSDRLLAAITEFNQGLPNSGEIYVVMPSAFEQIPGVPLSYWILDSVRSLFQHSQPFEDDRVQLRVTNPTADNFRYLRNYWEVPVSTIGREKGWVPYAKGGSSRKYYNDVNLVAAWDDSIPTYRGYTGTTHRPDIRPASLEHFFRPGIMWPLRAASMSAQAFPEGTIFSARSQCLFAPKTSLPYYLGLLNSSIVDYVFKAALGRTDFPEFIVGILRLMPKPRYADEHATRIGNVATKAAELSQELSLFDEVNHYFRYPRLLRHHELSSLVDSAELSIIEIEATHNAVSELQDGIDQLCFHAYGIRAEEQLVISRFLSETLALTDVDQPEDDDYLSDEDNVLALCHSLVSWAIGLPFGRWDIRIACANNKQTYRPKVFAPLPICPPGMLQNAHGLPAAPADVPAGYPLRISWPGILVDDPGHPEDIEARVRDALRVIWPGAEVSSEQWAANIKQRVEGAGSELSTDHWPLTTPATADAIEQETCQILGVGSLREYFASPSRFFDDHLKRYSKSRRQAPIYWPLSTRSGSYTLWLYYHRLNEQMLYTCVNDFVDPKLAVVSGQLAVLRRKSGRSREEERELEQLTDLETELKDFRAELLRIAAFWRPNLNDGVQITAAPLWRLFQHRPWHKTLKETWEKLEAGEYDWAHLAMSIWPERVVPKCVIDRSLAIAHDVEDMFWIEDPEGKWRNLRSPDEELAGQVDRQRSPARARLRDLFGELGRGRARGLRCAEVAEELSAGRWDDLEAALLLWPARVAEKCWDDPLLAMTLQINLPAKRTKAARERWVKERVAAGCPDLAEALMEALADRPDRFSVFWSELARGDRDELSLALALWPERVIEKCAVDVELAARHDVRRFLWVWGGEGVCRRRSVMEHEVANEIKQRLGLHGNMKVER